MTRLELAMDTWKQWRDRRTENFHCCGIARAEIGVEIETMKPWDTSPGVYVFFHQRNRKAPLKATAMYFSYGAAHSELDVAHDRDSEELFDVAGRWA